MDARTKFFLWSYFFPLLILFPLLGNQMEKLDERHQRLRALNIFATLSYFYRTGLCVFVFLWKRLACYFFQRRHKLVLLGLGNCFLLWFQGALGSKSSRPNFNRPIPVRTPRKVQTDITGLSIRFILLLLLGRGPHRSRLRPPRRVRPRRMTGRAFPTRQYGYGVGGRVKERQLLFDENIC